MKPSPMCQHGNEVYKVSYAANFSFKLIVCDCEKIEPGNLQNNVHHICAGCSGGDAALLEDGLLLSLGFETVSQHNMTISRSFK